MKRRVHAEIRNEKKREKCDGVKFRIRRRCESFTTYNEKCIKRPRLKHE